MSSLATSYDTVRRRGKMETHELTEGSTENAKCPENVEKVQAANIKNPTIQNVDYFEMRGGGLDFHIFPKFKLLKYGLDSDDTSLNS